MSIEITNLNYKIKDVNILKKINLEIYEKEILAIIGPNGSGKSSLIKNIAGDFLNYDGNIILNGLELKNISLPKQAKIRSVMSQSQKIIYDFSVKEIIEMGWLKMEQKKQKNMDFHKVFKNICVECNIIEILNRKYNSLSGGEQRSVDFARTLIQVPYDKALKKYLILDEPTANLDISHKISMMKLLNKYKNKGFGIIVVLHDLNLAYKFSDKIGIMKDGELKYYGKKENILTTEILSHIYNTPIKVNKEKIITYY